MRIVVVSPLPPRHDGIADYSARLIHAYRAEGHDLAAVTPDQTTTAVPVLGSLSLHPGRWSRTLIAVLRHRPDTVHVQHTIATYGPLLAALWPLVAVLRLAGVAVVVTHHEVTRDLGRLGAPGRLYYAAVSRLAGQVHVHTQRAADVMTSRLGIAAERVTLQPHPVFDLPPADCDPAELAQRHGLAGRSVLLVFGYVTPEKGTLEALDGVAELLRRRPGLRARLALVVAGEVRPRSAGFTRFEQADRDHLQALHHRSTELGLDDVVRFVGHVPDGAVAAWFRLAELVLLPYTNTEGSGVANLAVAAGAPVLAADNGGLAELFADLPRLPSLTPDVFADALDEALADPQTTRERSSRAYARLTLLGQPVTELAGSGWDQLEGSVR